MPYCLLEHIAAISKCRLEGWVGCFEVCFRCCLKSFAPRWLYRAMAASKKGRRDRLRASVPGVLADVGSNSPKTPKAYAFAARQSIWADHLNKQQATAEESFRKP